MKYLLGLTTLLSMSGCSHEKPVHETEKIQLANEADRIKLAEKARETVQCVMDEYLPKPLVATHGKPEGMSHSMFKEFFSEFFNHDFDFQSGSMKGLNYLSFETGDYTIGIRSRWNKGKKVPRDVFASRRREEQRCKSFSHKDWKKPEVISCRTQNHGIKPIQANEVPVYRNMLRDILTECKKIREYKNLGGERVKKWAEGRRK